jgi:chromosome partitioning protein
MTTKAHRSDALASDAEPTRRTHDLAATTTRIIAIANQKGGTGKTTTTVNLAAALGERRQPVLVIDLDPQANASSWLGARDGGSGLLDALVAEDGASLADLVRPSCAAGVDVIAASAQLARAEHHLAQTLGGEMILLGLLGTLPRGRWEYVLIDCPPALGLLTINALAAAGELLVPVEASTMAVAGLASLVKTVTQARKRLNANLVIGGIVACRVDGRTVLARDVVVTLRKTFPEITLATTIRESIRLREAPAHAPILLYAPASSGAEDYRQLAAEVSRLEPRHAFAPR